MIKVNDLIKIIELDAEDTMRFIELGQGGNVVELCDEGVYINWCIVNNITPENDASDGYFLYYNQIERVL